MCLVHGDTRAVSMKREAPVGPAVLPGITGPACI